MFFKVTEGINKNKIIIIFCLIPKNPYDIVKSADFSLVFFSLRE